MKRSSFTHAASTKGSAPDCKVYLNNSGSNYIGGVTAPNTVVYNGAAGISILSGSGNAISANYIYDNGGLGIDLGDDGPRPSHRFAHPDNSVAAGHQWHRKQRHRHELCHHRRPGGWQPVFPPAPAMTTHSQPCLRKRPAVHMPGGNAGHPFVRMQS